MSTRIVALFNLRPGITPEAYEHWARTTDIPTVRALASIGAFEVYRGTSRLGSDAPSPYDYIEIIDVEDMAGFGGDVASERMQAVSMAFQSMADVVFILTERLT